LVLGFLAEMKKTLQGRKERQTSELEKLGAETCRYGVDPKEYCPPRPPGWLPSALGATRSALLSLLDGRQTSLGLLLLFSATKTSATTLKVKTLVQILSFYAQRLTVLSDRLRRYGRSPTQTLEASHTFLRPAELA
jgi:hypothetical protein